MIEVCRNALMQFPLPLVLTDSAGVIKEINKAAQNLLQIPAKKADIDPHLSKVSFYGNVQGENVSFKADILPVSYKSKSSYLIFLKKNDDLNIDQVLENIDDAIVVADKYGVVEKMNEGFTRLSGVDRNLMIGFNLRDIVAQKIILHESSTIKALELKKNVNMNVQYQTGKHVTWTSKLTRDEEGNIEHVVSTGRDITELINLEEELRKTEALKDEYYIKLKEFEEFLGEGRIIHSSEEMQRVLKTSIKASKSDSSVFIWGESGVGKEVIAKLIHRLSDRKEKPFIGVNCAAIPSELLEAEFFGYEEGAFTSCRKGGSKGLFEEADGGMIFLDEVGELPFQMQSKFLRVLQEKQVMRVGGNKIIPINVRIMSSTNLSKEQLIDNRKFRQDLFYRLSVIPIYIPPLRERRDDIIPLIHFYLNYFNKQHGSNIRIPQNLLMRLYNYDWPGNVRELKNVVERLVILSDAGEVSESNYDMVNQFGMDVDDKAEISITKLMPLKEATSKIEEIIIRKAYKEQGSIVKTAQLLKVDPATLHRKIKKNHIKINP